MKYLFLDIECSNCFDSIGKMCEFGYVLTDENFNIIGKRDIPMNPGRGPNNRFHLKGRKHERDLELAYDYSYYFDQEEFPYFYNQIKSLVEDEDTLCFAWSYGNDILHLHHSCTRYHLEPFKYKCFDVQKVAGKYLNKNNQLSLKQACKQIVGPNATIGLQEHLSRDDAKMTMMILEAICVLEKKTSKQIIDEYQNIIVDGKRYAEESEERYEQKSEIDKKHRLYKDAVKHDSEIISALLPNIKRYNFSGDIKHKVDDIQTVINQVHSNNGLLVNDLESTDIFVVYDEADKEKVINAFSKYENDIKFEYLLLSDLMRCTEDVK